MWKSLANICLLCMAVVSSQGGQCGPEILTGESGWFTSPSYLILYPSMTLCDWRIRVQEGNSILIEFVDFRADGSAINGEAEKLANVLIFDTNEDSPSNHFNRSAAVHMQSGGMGLSFLSKSNMVVVRYASLGRENSLVFNATYKSVNRLDFCNEAKLLRDRRIDAAKTKCATENSRRRYFKTCRIACSPGYTERQAIISCDKGNFESHDPCVPISSEVELCRHPQMKRCIYTLEELVEYWAKYDGETLANEEGMVSDVLLSDASNGDFAGGVRENDPAEKGIDLERRAQDVAARTQGICFDDVWRQQSFCSKQSDGSFSFSCSSYIEPFASSNVPKAALRLARTCEHCQNIGCTVMIYI